MIIDILAVVGVIIVGFLIVVATQPADFRVASSGTVPAAPAVVFEHVNDLHRWAAWSPWDRIDPAVKKTFEGPAAGVGASYSWVGEKTGEGKMTVAESRPYELIRFNLDFTKPFKANNIAEFTFRPEGNQTVVTWSITGKNNFMGKAFNMFVNCGAMVSGQFDKGLANLKEVVEKGG